MTWQEKIIQGMRLIHEGCEETEDCKDCPFVEVCDASYYQNGAPSNWIV